MAETLVVLGGAFLVCGLIARVGVPIGLPTIPLFMLAGVFLGPSTPGFDLVQDPAELALVARLGLVFLLFYLGLEFSLDQLVAGGRRLVAVAVIYLVLNIGGGLGLGLSFGCGTRESLVVAGVVGISSSAIVTKLLVDLRRLGNRESRVILGIIVIEDVFLGLYLALLQPVLGGAEGPAAAVAGVASAFGFLLALALVARYGARWIGRLIDTKDEEIVVVVFVGLAVFFHFGLSIDPAGLWAVLPQIAFAVVTTVAFALTAGVIASRIYGFGRVEAANVGLTVLTRGEFSLILATLALAAGLDQRIGMFTAGYILMLAVLGPLAVSHSEILARFLPARLLPGRAERAERDTPMVMDVGPGTLDQLGTDLLQIHVVPGSRLHGLYVTELRLPDGTTLGLLARDGRTEVAGPGTRLRVGDALVVFTPPRQRQATEERIRAVHRSGRLARWRGDHGR